MFNVVCCQHSLFAHQTVRTASVLRLTSAAQAGEPFGFVQHSLFAHQTVRTASVLRLTSAAQAGEAFGFVVIVFTFLFSYYLFQNLLQQKSSRESDSYGNEECRPISEMKSRKRL